MTRTTRRSFLALVPVAALAGCTSIKATALAPFEREFAFRGAGPKGTLEAVNEARRSGRRGAMRIDARAQKAAERHARDMARANKMAHELPGRPKFTERLEKAGIRTVAAENVAWGQGDVAGAVTAWMNSSGHRRNMLDERFEGVGVASARGRDGRLYWAMVLVP